MPLTNTDKSVLQSYVTNGDRYNYWKYLAQRTSDPYAQLALGVVTNETLEGYIANQYAASRAADLGRALTDQQWWQIGVDIMAADFEARTSNQSSVTTDGGMTLTRSMRRQGTGTPLSITRKGSPA